MSFIVFRKSGKDQGRRSTEGKSVVYLWCLLGNTGPFTVRCWLFCVHFGCAHGCVLPGSEAAVFSSGTERQRLEAALSSLFLCTLPLSRFSLCFVHLICPLPSPLDGSLWCPPGRHCFAACSSSELPSLITRGSHCTAARHVTAF